VKNDRIIIEKLTEIYEELNKSCLLSGIFATFVEGIRKTTKILQAL
jgi:hypothetical protein